jgi:hypothetical protein
MLIYLSLTLYNQELTAAFNNTLKNNLKVCGVLGCIASLHSSFYYWMEAVVSFLPWLLFIYVCISWLAEHNT